MNTKKTILRKCISCGEIKPQEDLIKITKEYKNGNVVIQPNSKTFGRSAYLCYNQECINNAFKKTKINRALRTNASINKEMLLDLVQHTNK